MHFLKDVSGRLQSERKRIGLSQEIFGKELGVSKRTQAGYEGGANAPDAIYLIEAKKLGVDINFVLFGHRSSIHMTEHESELVSLVRASGDSTAEALIALLKTMTREDEKR